MASCDEAQDWSSEILLTMKGRGEGSSALSGMVSIPGSGRLVKAFVQEGVGEMEEPGGGEWEGEGEQGLSL